MLGKIKVWAEKTSTSPATQVHLGHAKAYIAEPNFAMDSPEGEKLTQQREMLIKGHVASKAQVMSKYITVVYLH